jgi:PAS domain S-box-containing protein
MEQKAIKRQARFKAIFNNSPFGIAIVNLDGTHLFLNPAFTKISGYSEEEAGRLQLAQHTHPEDLDRERPLYQALLSGDQDHYEIEKRVFHKDGHLLWVHVQVVLVRDVEGKPDYLVAIGQDISDRKLAEKALRVSERRYRDLFDDAPVIYIITEERNGEPIITDVNKLFTSLLGYPRKDVIGKSLTEFYTPASVHELMDRGGYQKALSGTFTEAERSFVTSDGRIIDTLVQASLVKDDPKKRNVVRSTFINITERKKVEREKKELQTQLIYSQKMEAIGNLAGGIAHDFNNILSSIIGFTQLALDDSDKGSLLADYLQEVYTAGKRAKDLVGQILAFARQSDEKAIPLQVNLIINEVLQFIRSSIPTSIEIKKNISSDSFIMGNQTQLHQIMMNLCTNAAQAMAEKGGILEVTLQDVAVDRNFEYPNLDLTHGDYIEIGVSDTGTGIAPETLVSVFEPYFTTKETGSGTGLGLAVVHGIVESYGGKITVDSQLGKGTTFTIYLPVTQKRREEHKYETELLPTGSETILFVDDETPIVKMGAQVLEQLGYKVTTLTSSKDALELFKSTPKKFDLVITDMTMPKMTGDKLAIELMKICPDIPVILCTGYSKTITDEIANEIGIKAFTYKPVVKADLANTVRKVLDEAKADDRG